MKMIYCTLLLRDIITNLRGIWARSHKENDWQRGKNSTIDMRKGDENNNKEIKSDLH